MLACSAFWASYWFSLLVGARAQIRVLAPDALVKSFSSTSGRIEGATATFGAPFYGERLLGRLVWSDPGKHNHCKASDYDVPRPEPFLSGNPQGEYRGRPLLHIVMVRRGTCSFVTKVKVAEKKGAQAVVVVDRENSKLRPGNFRTVIVSDDGYGDSVDIPSLLISHQEGQLLIDAAKTTSVIVELAWDVPRNHSVIMDLWMSSASRQSQEFLQEFSPKRKALSKAVTFVPHFHVFGMKSADYNDRCTSSDAMYCADDPDGSGPVTGKMVLEEDVRQLCIHDITEVKVANSSEVADKFWSYVEQFAQSCPVSGPHKDSQFGRSCSERLMKRLGIPVDQVRRCVSTTSERKLEHEKSNIAWSPHALRINGWRYSGPLDADLVTRAICAGFKKKVDACERLVEPLNHFQHNATRYTVNGVGSRTFVATLLGIAVVSSVACIMYKRSLTGSIHKALREEAMREVRSQSDMFQEIYRELPS